MSEPEASIELDVKPKPPALQMKDMLDSVLDLLSRIAPVMGTIRQEQVEVGKGLKALAEYQDDCVQAVKDMHTQEGEIVKRLDVLIQRTNPEAAPRRRWNWRWLGAGAVLLGVVAGGLWYGWPDTRYHTLSLGVDAVLVQQYGALPKPVQGQLDEAYRRQGVVGPGQRQPKGNGR